MFGTESIISLVLQGKDQASSAFNVVGNAVGGLGSALTSIATGGLVIFATELAAASGVAFSFSQEVDTALNLVSAQTGLTGNALDQFKDQAEGVFLNNWGDSFEDVAQSMATVRNMTQANGDALGELLGELTEGALILRDVFEVDVAESTDAVNALMENFGLTGQEALDLITSGFQRGLNSSDDFLDTIGEYSNQFGDAGFDAEQFFSILETGNANGVLGTDKVADAVKEMSIILAEGGDDVSAAFTAIGLDFDGLQENVAGGDASWADYFDQIVGGLADIDDPIQRATAQTTIFGTMAEDLGVNFTDGLSSAQTALEDLVGATQQAGNAVSQGLGPAWESFKRQALVAIEPLGNALGDALLSLTPVLSVIGNWLAVNIPQAIQLLRDFWTANIQPLFAGFSTQITDLSPIINGLSNLFSGGLAVAFQVVETYWNAYLQPVFSAITQVINASIIPLFNDVGSLLGQSMPSIIQSVSGIWSSVFVPALTFAGNVVSTILIPAIGNAVDWLRSNLPLAVATASDIWQTRLQPALQAVQSVIQNDIIPAFNTTATWLQDNIPQAIQTAVAFWQSTLKPAFDLIYSTLVTNLQPAFNTLEQWFSQKAPLAITALIIFWNTQLQPALTSVWEFIQTNLNPIFGKVGEWLQEKIPLLPNKLPPT